MIIVMVITTISSSRACTGYVYIMSPKTRKKKQNFKYARDSKAVVLNERQRGRVIICYSGKCARYVFYSSKRKSRKIKKE